MKRNPAEEIGKRQTRSLDRPPAPLTLRAAEDSLPGFTGRVSTYWVVDSYGTCRAPGAFDKTVEERGDQIQILRNHYYDYNIGYPSDLPLTDEGLDVDAVLIDDDNGPAHWTIASLRGGGRWGLSFGFDVLQARAATDQDPLILIYAPAWIKQDPTMVYVHTEIRLWEVSPVTWASDPTAKPTSVRGDDDLPLLESLLDDVRAGRLTPERRALLDRLVAAARETAGPDRGEMPAEPPTDMPDVRNQVAFLELELALLELAA